MATVQEALEKRSGGIDLGRTPIAGAGGNVHMPAL